MGSPLMHDMSLSSWDATRLALAPHPLTLTCLLLHPPHLPSAHLTPTPQPLHVSPHLTLTLAPSPNANPTHTLADAPAACKVSNRHLPPCLLCTTFAC